MKITRNKAVTLVTIILLLPILPSAFFTANAAQSGQGYQYNYIILNPDGLVGVGQIVYITCWTHRYVGQVGNPSSYFFHNWTVVVHRPDNKTEYVRGGGFHVPGEPEDTIWDSTATAFSSYTPTLNGTYIFEFYFPNQTVTSGSNAGYYWTNYNSTAKLVVQEEQIVYAMDSYPLPSEYWYRPIEAQNSWWAGFVGAVTSNWYNSVRDKNYNGNPNVRYQPDGIAPATAHIMWSAPIFDSPTTANLAASDYYTNPIFGTAIALRGQLFYPTTDGATWRQVDLRTGQLINSTASVYDDISFGWNFDEQTENTHGVVQSGFLFTTNYARAMEATVLQIGHGWTWTMANVPTHGIEAIGSKGEHIIFSIANAGTTANPRWVVRDWNNSKVFVQSQTSFTVSSASSSTNSSDWQWNIVTRGTAPSKVVLAADSLEVGAYATNDPYYAKFDKAILLCRNGTMPSPGDRSSVTYFAIAAANQTIGKTNWQIGQLMWMKNIDAPSDGSSLVQGPSAEGVFTLVSPETGTWYGYDIMTGNLMWTTEPQTNYTPYGYTVGTNATGCTVSIGDHVVNATSLVPFPYTGKLITAGMGGVVFCYNLSNGAMLWHKEFPMSYSASVPNYPTNIGLLSDGKVYLGTFNPSADEPLLSGSMIRCLNTTDGSEIWSMPGFGSAGGYGVSDGYLFFANYYDWSVYCVGKGPSAMTLSPAQDVAFNGAPVTLTGTCLDMSPNAAVKGTAAISDESMGAWMAYKFMDEPMPKDVTGVTVYLSTIDPNNNQEFIGTATVNPDGTFSYEWTPPVPGTYQLTAQFLGSNSYYPSLAHSTLFVSDQGAATANPTAPPPGPAMTNTYLAASAGAIMATLIVVAAAILLMLRKRP